MATDEIYTKSVTADELGKVRNGAVMQLIVPFYGQNYDRYPLPPVLTPYWSPQRDILLRGTVYHEAMWAAAVGIAITKIASLSWEVSGESSKKLLKDTQEIFLQADGRKVGWSNFLAKQLRDYLLTDNGCFIEIVRASKYAGSRIVGLRHLDSVRVTRTGDPEIPVLYRSRDGKIHELKDYQVMQFSEMPEPSESYNGVGLCAASRAYPSIYKLASIENYLREKVSGLRPLAIYIVNGILDTQLKGAIDAARSDEVSRGLAAYMGAVIVGVPDENPPELVTIPLAELPDRFSRKEEFDISVLTYADVLGLDPQELQPLGGQALGTGAQSQVLHDKALGKGLVSWKQAFVHQVNEYVCPAKLTFAWIEKDYRDISQRLANSKAMVDVAVARIQAQITTPQQEIQLLVENDELPKEFLQNFTQFGAGSLSDDEKPEDLPEGGQENTGVLGANQQQLQPGQQPVQEQVVQKVDPQTGKPMVDPQTGQPIMEKKPVQPAQAQGTQAGQQPKPKSDGSPKVWGVQPQEAVQQQPVEKPVEEDEEEIEEPESEEEDEKKPKKKPASKPKQGGSTEPQVWGIKEVEETEKAYGSLDRASLLLADGRISGGAKRIFKRAMKPKVRDQQ